MIKEGYCLLFDAAGKKVEFYKSSKPAYFISSLLAGLYVGICMVTILVMGGMFDNFAGIKILQGASFAAALSLVVFAGSELFTGNVFVMTAGVAGKKVSVRDAAGLCAFCYFGNLAGSLLVAALFLGTGYLQGHVLTAATASIIAKTSPGASELLIRGILCNLLVCAGVWCYYRLKSESGKLILIFWCIYLFVVCGFEHCIANMTLFGLGTFANLGGVSSLVPMAANLASTTLGNILGGMALSVAYYAIAKTGAPFGAGRDKPDEQ
ncbi:MAG: formate/nitrite transporter family protein [Defluviitaleaceae bacterium]|nr:formate/nitrite transporter family protein [Defluviitaleaceae bacterium]